ncbi:TPA: hypothetical protein OMH15_003789 [Escherichia coli]|uniref:hypothetical protein n=1 Tax=Escherichia coli TaxID=562 RepID=UPI0005AAF3C9|nr:hypothetical protein [Escherichia coli]EMB3656776.1 hypothetical protein [Escherichia coli]HCQ8773909.1 hypothetical protein [Escherichia coli]
MKNKDFDVAFEELLDEFERCVKKLKDVSHFKQNSAERKIRKLEEDALTVITDYRNGKIQADKYTYRELTIEEYVSSMESAARWQGEPSKFLKAAFVSHKWGKSQYKLGHKAEGRKHALIALKLMYIWTGANWALEIVAAKEQSDKIKREAASLGGKNKAQNYRRVKDEVIRLLKENMPEHGWKSKVAAINSLEKEITKFIELDTSKNHDWTSWEKLLRTISDWSRNDIELKEIFSEVVKK